MTIIGNTSILSISPAPVALPAPLCPQCGTATDACRCGFCEETAANEARRETTES